MRQSVERIPSRAAAPGVDPNPSFLSVYFREMAPLPLLDPEQELAAARRIEELEVNLWTHLLQESRCAELTLEVMARSSELELDGLIPAIRRLARGPRGKTRLARSRHLERCAMLAAELHRGDQDRRLLLAVMAALRERAPGENRPSRATVKFRTRGFAAFHRRAKQLFASSERARGEFIQSNLRLVVSIARRFLQGRAALPDLIQEGNLGLIKAVERYDYRRGFRFSTYASWWIRHSISRALADKGHAIRIPVHALDACHKLARAERDLSSKLGRRATVDELGCSTGMDPEKVAEIQGYLLDELSLDRAVSESDDRRFIDLLQDPVAAAPVESVEDQSVSEEVQEILGELRPIESEVLRRRFGLGEAEAETLRQIGDSFQLSRERIRQIQEQALIKIRRALQRRKAV